MVSVETPPPQKKKKNQDAAKIYTQFFEIGGSVVVSKIGLLEAPNNLILPLLENKILNGIEANGRKSFKFGKNVGV